MGEAERLLARFDAGTLLPPSTAIPNSVDLARAIAAACGAPGMALEGGASRIAALIGAPEHLVFVVVDGLGLQLLERLPESAFLRRQTALELRSVFPSATAAALTSLATGMWPARHGVPGWHMLLPEHDLTATILPFIERFSGRPLGELGVSPEYALPTPILASAYTRERRAYLPRAITGSVYSGYVTGDGAQVPYGTVAEAIDLIAADLARRPAPSYAYVYVPQVDAIGHEAGPYSERSMEVLRFLDAELARLAAAPLGDARLVVSADHGQITVALDDVARFDAEWDLLGMLRVPPAGEPRAPRFHLNSPDDAAAFSAAFLDRFGERFALLTTGQAEALRLFGPEPIAPALRSRFGDLQGVALGHSALLYAREASAGDHGGLSPEEMRIPLIVV